MSEDITKMWKELTRLKAQLVEQTERVHNETQKMIGIARSVVEQAGAIEFALIKTEKKQSVDRI